MHVFGIAAVVAGLAVFAGCGGGGGGGSSTGSGSIDVPSKTIAYGELVGDASESAKRQATAIKEAADALGWELRYVQGEGDIPGLTQGLVSAINAGADAMIVTSTAASEIQPAMDAAERKGIPVIAGGGQSDPEGFTASYQESEEEMSELLTKQLVEEVGGKGTLGVLDNTQILPGQLRESAREKVLEGTEIETVARSDSDLANLIGGAKTAVNAMLTKDPSLESLWLVYDAMMPPALEALTQRGNSTTGVYSFFANPSNLETMRKNENVKALAENDLEHTDLIALDQLVAHFSEEEAEINKSALEECPLQYTVVTRENMPAQGKAVFPIPPQVQAFVKNWEAGKFGQGADCGK
jgi:ribose transport system substrate-binding protein